MTLGGTESTFFTVYTQELFLFALSLVVQNIAKVDGPNSVTEPVVLHHVALIPEKSDAVGSVRAVVAFVSTPFDGEIVLLAGHTEKE